MYVLDLSMVMASLLADLYKPYLGVKGEVPSYSYIFITERNIHPFLSLQNSPMDLCAAKIELQHAFTLLLRVSFCGMIVIVIMVMIIVIVMVLVIVI